MLNLYHSLHYVQQMQFIPFLVLLAFKIVMDYEREKKPKKRQTRSLSLDNEKLLSY